MERQEVYDRLADVLADFPTVLLPIVNGYAEERPHFWLRDGINDWPTIDVTHNVMACDDDDRPFGQYRIVSRQSVVDGPPKWIVTIDFDGDRFGCIAAGVTVDRSNRMVPPGSAWSKIASADDFVVETHTCPDWKPDDRVEIFHNRKKTTMVDVRLQKNPTATLTFELISDADRRMMRIADGASLQIAVELPTIADDQVWRPCIVFSGCVAATVRPSS